MVHVQHEHPTGSHLQRPCLPFVVSRVVPVSAPGLVSGSVHGGSTALLGHGLRLHRRNVREAESFKVQGFGGVSCLMEQCDICKNIEFAVNGYI